MVTAPSDGTATMSDNENSAEPVPADDVAPETAHADAPDASADAPAENSAAEAAPTPSAPEVADNKRWYVVKVQSGREDSIKDALWRRVKMNGLERYFKEIVVPTEDVIEFNKTGKKKTVKTHKASSPSVKV